MTPLGTRQSERAGRELRDVIAERDDDGERLYPRIHVIVSPLRRALQTARGILSRIDDDDETDLRVTVHPAAAEVLRDACDIGTPVDLLEGEFPAAFRWDPVRRHAGPDGIWWGDRRSDASESWRRMKGGSPDGMETAEQVGERLRTLREYVCERSEADLVIVVCHSETIWCLSSQRGADNDLYGIWTKNGEIVDLTEHIVRVNDDPTDVSSCQSSSEGSSGSGLDDRYQPFEVFLT